ncbi:MAG TPA: FKBP-type peptidyl-prolyl cis-trans isomerase [Myxococcaceae bacterium]|nr:FKBP-type peptidyl-prolyl cis-trans isomerase [Myxococcaceae bacterium]
MRAVAIVFCTLLVAGCRSKSGPGSLEKGRDKLSYAIGVEMSQDIKREHLEVDPELVARGLSDGLGGKQLLLSEVELRDTAAAFNNMRRESARAAAEENHKRAEAFLAENSRRPGVTTLPSGLQYEVLKTGNEGRPPTDADVAVCHYRGTFVDGTEFDSSAGRPVPFTFRVGTVMPGWREALHLMPVGSRWKLYVPPQLAYGEQGLKAKSGKTVPPNAALIFELELLGVRQADPGGRNVASGVLRPGADEKVHAQQ